MKRVNSLKEAVIATLSYFNLFEYPLTLEEVGYYLYQWNASDEEVKRVLNSSPEIQSADGYFFLKGKKNIVEVRNERSKIAERFWKKVKRYEWIFAMCPFVRMVAVTNTLAYNNVKKESDIDLFIVVENGHLDSARFFLKALTQVFGMRVHHNKIAGRFCLSFVVTENGMNLENVTLPFDPHLAYFVRSAQPIYGVKMYERWLIASRNWTKRYFHEPLEHRGGAYRRHAISEKLKTILEKFVNKYSFEKRLEQFNLERDNNYKKRVKDLSNVVTTPDIFKFHENDSRQEIARSFS